MEQNADTMLQITEKTVLDDIVNAENQTDADRDAAAHTDNHNSTPTDVDTTGMGSVDIAGMGSSSVEFVEQAGDKPLLERTPTRFFGSVRIDSARYVRDIGNVTREVIDRL